MIGGAHRVLRRLVHALEILLHAAPALQLFAIFLISLIVAVLSGVFAHWASAPYQPVSFREGVWWAITHLLDGGTVASDTGLWTRALGVSVTLFGLVLVALLTGAFASTFSESLERVRSGAIQAYERDHLLFLGWNASAGVALRELAASGIRRSIVIVSDQRRELVEEQVRDYLGPRAPLLDIVFRSGDPTTVSAVARGAARHAGAIVILPEADPSAAEQGDGLALRSLLAARRALRGRDVPLLIEGTGSTGRALLGLCATPGQVAVVQARDLHARLLARAVLSPGIFAVAQRLLALGPHAVFAHSAAAFAGETFDGAHAAADSGVLVGVVRDGRPELCPEGSMTLRRDDELLFLAARGAPMRANGALPLCPVALTAPRPRDRPFSLLVLRSSPELPRVLRALDTHEPVRAAILCGPDEIGALSAALDPARLGLGRTTVEILAGDPSDEKTLDAILERRWDAALQLATPVPAAMAHHEDAKHLLTLLHVGLPRGPGGGAAHTLVELRSPGMLRLARGLSDSAACVLSRELTGLILAREISARCGARARDERDARPDLLDDVAASVELRAVTPAPCCEVLTFAHLAAAARRRGEIALGILEPGCPAPRLFLPRNEPIHFAPELRVVVLTSAEIRAGGAVDAVPPRNSFTP